MLNRGYSYREQLSDRAGGRTLLEYLSQRYPHSSEVEWRRHIAQGRVLLNGETAASTHSLSAGQSLVWNRPPWEEPSAPRGAALLYRDPHLLGVAKPQGLPTMPGGGFLEQTLLSRIRKLDRAAAPLHRLGRGTSGVVLFARNALAQNHMMQAWQRGEVQRIYRGLVRGQFPTGSSSLRFPIGRVPHALLGTVHAVHPQGKTASSVVRLLERRDGASLVEIEIETGRTHQIRIHLAAAGYPLEGDPLYPPGGVPSPTTRTLPGELGYLLHAHQVSFAHPRSGATITVECHPPAQLRLQEVSR